MLATAFPLALSVAAWCFCIACLLPAVWRLLRRRGRYLDPVWALVAILALNRLSFMLADADSLSRGTAAALAVVMGGMSLSYQKGDR